MPIVTEINPQKRKKDRYNIYLDGEYAGSLNAEMLVLGGIKMNKEISSTKFKEILKQDNDKYAFDLALKAIAAKRRTVFETRSYLLDREIDEASVDHAINKVLEYGYLNDLEYAKEFVSYYINAEKYGRLTIAYKLKTKGIEESIIHTAITAFSEDIERSIAQKHYDKLTVKYQNLSPFERKGKISRALAAKGFGFEIINSIVTAKDNE